MKLTLSRMDLIKALGSTHRVVERRNTIPILSNVLLKAGGSSSPEGGSPNSVHFKATDLDIEISLTVPASVEAPGSATVPAHMLYDIARKLNEGADVMLDASAGDGRMIVRAGRSRFVLQTLPETDFPDISVGEMTTSFEIGGAVLAGMIADCEFAISTEETRYYLNGIYLHHAEIDGAAQLVAVSTDGHRLAKRTVTAPEGSADMPGVIIPRKAVGEIARLLDKVKDPVLVEISAAKLVVTVGTTRLVTKLIDGTFPHYQRVIPAGNGKFATILAGELNAAIDRVGTVSSEKGRAMKFAFADGRLNITVSNPDAGSASEEMEVGYDDDPLEIGFNGRYLADILGVLIRGGAEQVRIAMDSPGSPAIIQSSAGSDLLMVLMPMRV